MSQSRFSISPPWQYISIDMMLGWTPQQWACAARLFPGYPPTIEGAYELKRYWKGQGPDDPMDVVMPARPYVEPNSDWAAEMLLEAARMLLRGEFFADP